MNFQLFFLIFLPLISAYPTADKTDIKTDNSSWIAFLEEVNRSECREDADRFSKCMAEFVPKNDLLQLENGQNRTKEEAHHFLSSFKKAMDCIGVVTCKPLKLSKFILDSNIFIDEQLNLVEECLEKSSIETLRDYCTSTTVPGISELASRINTSRCVASRLQCTDNDKITFLKAEFAKISVKQVVKTMKEKGIFETLANFNETFNPEDYENIEL